MPEWEFRLWDDADNRLLVAQTIPHLLKSYDNINRGVAKADIARCLYMYVHGGYYIDTDYKVLSSFNDFISPICVLPISRGSEELEFRLGNAVFGSSPLHPFWLAFVESVLVRDLGNIAEAEIEKVTGPEGLTDFYMSNSQKFDGITLVPRSTFHPEIVFGGVGIKRSPDTIGAHLCWGSWRTKSTLKNIKALVARKITAI